MRSERAWRALAAVAAGLALGARRAHRRAPPLAVGAIAGLVCYAAHAPLDWDWQMPAVTLVAIVLAGVVIAQAEAADGEAAPALSPSAGAR